MSISYEEALATLESMFGAPWTRESLDLILRHFNGHMENTVESILSHGDGDPQALVIKLEAAKKQDTSLDEQLARQLAEQGGGQAAAQQPAAGAGQPSTSAPSSTTTTTTTTKKGRGTPTELPADFLRIPGYKGPAGVGSTSGAESLDSDEALARMLQDEMFSQELSRNPDFAHLARGRQPGAGAGYPGVARGQQQQQQQQPPPQMPTMPEIMEKVNELGNNARHKLSLMAAQFRANTARFQQNNNNPNEVSPGGKTYPEMRGLLDEDTDQMELAARKDL